MPNCYICQREFLQGETMAIVYNNGYMIIMIQHYGTVDGMNMANTFHELLLNAGFQISLVCESHMPLTQSQARYNLYNGKH